ncbi:hemolysin III family protein, partial [Bifidobacterium longum]
MAKPTNAEIEAKRAVIAEAREQALQAKAETIRVKAHNKAENIRRK